MKWVKDNKILYGHVGDKIKIFQMFLNEEFGFNLDEDGYFGEKTYLAIGKLKIITKPIEPIKTVTNEGETKIIDIIDKLARGTFKKRYMKNVTTIVIHHTSVLSSVFPRKNGETSPEFNAKYHLEKWGAGISYNFEIDFGEEIIYRCLNYEDKGYGVRNNNSYTYHICVSANFEVEKVPEKVYGMITQTIKLIEKETNKKYKILGHNEIKGTNTDCPGKNLDMNKLRSLL